MKISLIVLALTVTDIAVAAPVTYTIEPTHTYPSFEADHQGGMSIWRGKFNKSSGSVQYDKEGKSGSVDISVDLNSVDFGYDRMNEQARSDRFFDVAKFPTANYKGKFTQFDGDKPTEVQGELTLHGVTKPVTLKIHSVLCRTNAVQKKETCGADASTTFSRADFGIDFGATTGYKQDIKLAIQVEANRTTE
jgi:polyisoprenoid-binding protein YceI